MEICALPEFSQMLIVDSVLVLMMMQGKILG